MQNLAWLNAKYALFIRGAELNSIVFDSYQDTEIMATKQSVSSYYPGHIYNCDGTQINFNKADYLENSTKRIRLAIIY